MKRVMLFVMFLFGFIFAFSSVAATVPDGKIIVRIEDGTTSRCINSATDRITMNLRRVVVKKDSGVFTEDKTAAIIISTVISGEEGGLMPRKVTFPRMYMVDVNPYSRGSVSLPVEEKLFSRFPLVNSGNSYDTAELEFTILAKKGTSTFGVALSALADISKSLPAPINPFSEGFKYFSDYANKVVEGSLASESNVGQQSKEGKIILSFSSTGACTGDQEQTGTLAVVSGAVGKESDGLVDIKKSYCWKADLRPVFTLKFATKPTNSTCGAVDDGAYRQVTNPHIAFYLNAEPRALTLSKSSQVKFLSLPEGDRVTPQVELGDVEGSVFASYELAPISELSSVYTLGVKNVTDRVSNVLEDRDFFGEKLKAVSLGEVDDSIALPTTAVDGLAIDLAESLSRCSAHGVSVKDCL